MSLRTFVFFTVVATGSAAFAAAPPLFPLQGYLTDSSGQPISTAVGVRFSVHTAPTGGTEIWGETQTLTPVAGAFVAYLGQVTSLPLDLFRNNGNTWLQVQVGADSPMARVRLGSVAYAAYAEYCGNVPTHTHPFTDITGRLAVGQLPTGVVLGAQSCPGTQKVVGFTAAGAVQCAADIDTDTQLTEVQVDTFVANNALSGDVTGAPASTSVVALRGRSVATTAPSTNDVLTYNGSAWAPSNNITLRSGSQLSAVSGSISNFANNPSFTGNPTFSGLPAFNNSSVPFSVASTGRVNNLNADSLDGYSSEAFLAAGGARHVGPCTFDGTNVSCTGPCTVSTTDGSISCGSNTVTNCQAVFPSGCPTDTNNPCSLSCVSRLRPGVAFANTPTISIPAQPAPGMEARLSVHIPHPILYCPSQPQSAWVFLAYATRGNSFPTAWLQQQFFLSQGSVTGNLGPADGMPEITGEATVSFGQNYSVLFAAYHTGDTTSPCWFVRPTSLTANGPSVLLKYQAVRSGL